jgi:alpha-L-fucosidase
MTGWFSTARFGMFIHWGHSSQQGIELSWPLTGWGLTPGAEVTVDQYHSSAATFDPREYDPKAWARLAKACGMQYAVLTTKHHDGYCLWDTKTTDFSVMQSPYGKDIVRQYADAFRAEGVRPGFYFSLADWHHPDYPAFTQEDTPYRFPAGKAADAERWPKFVDVMFAQVRELLTNYGEIAVIWFDGQWERTIDQWRAKELKEMILELQPGIMINDRLPGAGGYATPEQFVPAQPLPGPWESCVTMNESWAYNPRDPKYKSARALVHTLCEIAGKGGNLLLNAGPRGDGTLAPEQQERLEAIAGWMARHGESIIGTEPGVEPWQFYGPSTRRTGQGGGETVYLHCLMRPYDSVSLRGVRVKRVRSVRALGAGVELAHRPHLSIADRLFSSKDPIGELVIDVPESAIDEQATVIAVEFEGGASSGL